VNNSTYAHHGLSKNSLQLILTIIWTVLLSPCVAVLVLMLKYHLGASTEQPFFYSYSGLSVTVWLYCLIILLNGIFVLTVLLHEKRMERQYIKFHEADKESHKWDIF
jgi:hypothetical protein